MRCIRLGNVFDSNGQNGDVFSIYGLSPCIRAGGGVTGNGVGSCNAPKIIEIYER